MDEQYYKLFLKGDKEAFEKLVLTHKDNLIYFIYRYVKDINQAEDLAQDAFVEIYVNKERFNFKSSFKTYLYTIARNKSIDYIRRASKQVYMEDCEYVQEDRSQEKELEDKIIADEEKRLIFSAIKKLKKDYAQVIQLVYMQDMSHKEVAIVLGKTTPQVKVLVHRSRKALEKILKEEGYVHEK